MTDAAPPCPSCGAALRVVGDFLLCVREDDGKRVCRTSLPCPSCGAVWTVWADRPDSPPEPHPFPQVIRKREGGGGS
ncbi:dehydrogenase [Streptomyces sp. NPDC051940]|uniref:dehydrogenase n=1 Tax=Streptomyces sp. NPDC051940 TaxID=3155675 RepID=UPI003413F7E1